MNEFRLEIRVRPGAGRSKVAGEVGGRLLVAVGSQAVAGAATAEALAAIATAFGVKKAQVRLIHGATSRDKLVALTGDAANLARRAAELMGQ